MVYEPQEDSFLLEKVVKEVVQPGMKVLDVGTGSGIQAFAASDAGARTVLAVDIDLEALDAVVEELQKRQVKNVRVKQSDLFEGLGENDTFDVVIFNAPYLPDEKDDPDVALDGGVEGHELVVRFLEGVGKHLEPEGIVLLLFSTKTGMEQVMEAITANGFVAEEKAKEAMFFEGLYVLALTRV